MMASLAARFAQLRTKNESALVLFVTAGDPSLADLPQILDALVEGGADIIEIGLPFSDPIADGPTIQASSQRALDRGVTTRKALETLATWQGTTETPLVLMGYMNPVLKFGLSKFAAAAEHAGVAGTILSDLTPEESDAWLAASKGEGLANIFLAAPTSTDARLDEVCARASGFIYAVSRTGVTGDVKPTESEVGGLVGRLKQRSSLPVCVGFGIRTPEDVQAVCQVADGAVVGSWLVDKLAKDWEGGEGRAELVREIMALKAATKP